MISRSRLWPVAALTIFIFAFFTGGCNGPSGEDAAAGFRMRRLEPISPDNIDSLPPIPYFDLETGEGIHRFTVEIPRKGRRARPGGGRPPEATWEAGKAASPWAVSAGSDGTVMVVSPPFETEPAAIRDIEVEMTLDSPASGSTGSNKTAPQPFKVEIAWAELRESELKNWIWLAPALKVAENHSGFDRFTTRFGDDASAALLSGWRYVLGIKITGPSGFSARFRRIRFVPVWEEGMDYETKRDSSAADRDEGMVLVPAGEFLFYNYGSLDPFWQETSQEFTRLGIPAFFIDKYPYPNTLGVRPRVYVSWYEARTACFMQGKRLCTQLEWHKACGGPAGNRYPYGNDFIPGKCHFVEPGGGGGVEISKLARIGDYPGCVSGYGVYEMTGNINEWVDATVPFEIPRYGFDTPPPNRGMTLLKGGDWGMNRPDCGRRTHVHPPEQIFHDDGFRCCRDAPAAPRNTAENEN